MSPISEPIAIIGSGCRFPGESSTPSKLWTLLANPRDVLTKIPNIRFEPEGFYNDNGEYHGSTNVKESYLLSEDHRLFDAQFFKIKPIEAHSMDPQQRLLMETVYDSLESAGLTIQKMQGSDTAVYVGLMCEEYSAIVACDVDQLPTYTATATGRSIMSNRVSYFFDWHGPCMTIDTACSSSLVAVHQAIETLRNGSSKVAIAAGSNLLLGPTGYITESKLHMLSPGSRSRMWDADADGYARGDGIASLVLKKLSDAIKDGDHIDCIIRETGVNQDGRTTGITMPSSTAQETLIRATYAKAGLDVTKAEERCQFFEAHGTGTPAGDPIEASAIHNAFFGPDNREIKSGDTLYVGSIKTVIGHTEGTAGIAAVMKASLAIQNAKIPPNLHFRNLSPTVEPYYKNLKIATSALPWPTMPDGVPRRASVNSFGFGGTNAHAIIEQYIPEKWGALTETRSAPNFLPFCLSAASEKSLFEQARRLCSWVRNTAGISLPDLAWTLSDRRSVFPFRWYFSASNTEQLDTKIEKQLESSYEATPILSRTPKILGVFTGQGAQWAAMGRSLIRQSGYIENIIDQLETSLATLPDPPVWSLKGEILADADHSRVPEATLSQPLCTAIQIILVDMLKVAGIKFDAVVGHSSGEIGAAYAAGFLSAKDAIRIAYYRGVHSKLARGPNGEKGAMMVVGTSLDDALELCDFDELQGRVTVAANNSSSSVTLTGDEDGIQDAMEVLKDENKFARILRVDTAYHSHHMLHCASPYLESMRRCGIQPLDDAAHACSWFSSVTEHEITRRTEGLDGEYWKDNLVKSVMFRQAIERAVSAKGGFDLALEIGPHPALQGPTLQTIQELCGDRIPYTGLLNRGVDDIEAFSEALGYIWRHSSDSIVNFEAYDGALSGFQPLRMLKGLPTYAFDHDRIYWRESRLSKAIRTRKTPYHELLGVPCPDGTNPTLLRWKNLLDPKEIPWLKGHAVQGQVVFPAAGYISMAVDACRVLASDRTIQSLEILDFVIGKAIVFDERSLGIETMLTLLLDQEPDGDGGTLSGTLRLYASLASSNSDVNPLTLRCSCQILVVFGEPLADILPARGDKLGNVVDVDSDKFYKHLAEVGYEYSGLFRGLSHMKRTLDAGTARISSPARTDPVRSPTAHPAMLDCTIQAVLLGFCFPGDGKLYAMHVPTKIKRISINLPQLENETRAASLLPVDSVVNGTGVVSGDVRLFGADGSTALLQMEGIEVVSLSPAMPDDDAKLFFTSELGVAIPDGDLMSKCQRATEDDYAFAVVCERIAYFYLRNLLAVLTPKDIERSEWHHKRLVCYARKVLGELQSGIDPMTDPKWYNDSREDIMAMMDTHKHRLEIGLARAVGENLPAAVRGETVILEHMMADNHLNNLYQYGMGFLENTNFLAEAVAQIAFRYPHMNILEVGAGTGGATKVIMPKLGKAFSSYTFTDISGGFFPKARDVFNDYNDCMTFKTLDVEKDVVEQGFDEHSYDLVIASLVLHATSDIEHTLRNILRLLKPGGYIVMMEITNLRPVRLGFAMSGLQGWWLGDEEDGRLWSPAVDANRWNNILQQVGFSCIDAMTPELDPEPWLLSVMVSQAVDDRIRALRKPLTAPVPETAKNSAELIILGGAKLHTSLLASDIEPLVSSRFNNISRAATLEQLLNMDIKPRTTILSLTDLDSPVFKNITDDRLSSLQRLCDHARNVLWLTQDCGAGDPYQSMTVGFGRTVAVEIPQIRLQFLDFAGNTKPRPDFVAETLLRLVISEQWEIAGEMDRMLWSVEQELVLNEDRLFVRRLLPSTDRNDRYNSTRREVIKHVSPAIEQVSVVREQDRFVLTDKWTRSLLKTEDHAGTTTVRLSHSLLQPMKLARSGSFYVSLGKIAGSGRPVVALSKSLSSTICIPTEWALPYNAPQDENSAKYYLAAFASAALGRYLVSNAIPGTKIVTYEIPPFLVDSFATQASEKGITLVHATITPSKAFDPSLLYIHPRTLVRDIRNLIPKNVSLFVDFSLPTTIHKIGRMISAELSEVAPTITADALFGTEALKQQSAVFDELEWLICLASHLRPSLNAPIREIALADVSALVTANETDGTIVSWTANKTVPVKAENIDAHFTFKSDRTYILFGLSGQLGKSLCTWMVQHGARHVVLTSRRPDVDAAWVKTMKSLEADIQFKANDITDRDAVATMINDVRTTMPPIAGIANGAMVLQDTAIRAMDLEVLNRVLRPKVEGSRYLDELLKNDNLDFAIFFSSLAAVFGSHGQSNYTTANMYMNGLVGQRRKKGLPGSVIAIGTITGIGYMARELTEKDLTRIRTSGYSPLSERDFHQLFCEATLASRPDSCMNPEIVCGVNIARPGEKRPDTWHTNPMFSHCIIKRESVKKDNGSDAALPIKANLLAAKSMEAAFNVIKESFQRRLQGMLQSETTVNLHLPAEELGVDSLVAVDIRTWFLKELNVDLPVLKILGGASVADMLEYCLENISPELIPGVDVKSRFKATITNNNDLPPEAEPGSSDNRTVSSDQSKFSNQPTPVDTSTSQISIASSDNVGAVEEKADILARSEVMSFGQSRFWFLQFYLEDKTAFNIVTQITMKGYIHVENLRRAVALVGQHHAALRTRFFVDERGQPVQGILENSKLRLQHLDISKSEDAKAEFIRMKNHVYDLENGETMQMSLLSDSSNGTHYLIVGYHHINMDGISLGVLLGDIHKAYRGIRLAPVLQYPDFSARQRKALESGDMDNEIAFWKKEFEPFPQVLPLLPFSTARTRRPLSHYRAYTDEVTVPLNVADQIREVVRKYRVSSFHVYLATFRVLLMRIMGIDDIVIGMGDANRMEPELQNSIGMFLNLLPLRFRPTGQQQTFETALREARSQVGKALAHSRIPFDALLEELQAPRSADSAPLFQAFIDYRQPMPDRSHLLDCRTIKEDYVRGDTAYEIAIDIIDTHKGDARVQFNVPELLYSSTDVQVLSQTYIRLLSEYTKIPTTDLDHVPLFSSKEVQQAIQLGKGPAKDSEWKTLPLRIQEIISTYGDRVAVRDGHGQSFSYKQLGDKIRAITHQLTLAGVNSGSVVAVLQEPSVYWAVSVLSLLCMGAVYVPLDAQSPHKRLISIIQDSKPVALLAHAATKQLLGLLELDNSTWTIWIEQCLVGSNNIPLIEEKEDPHRPAFILYTSGSTGVPKGVVLKQSNLLNQIENTVKFYDVQPGWTVLQQTAYSFDISMWQLLIAVTSGGSLYVVPQQLRGDPLALCRIIATENITITGTTPSEYGSWLRHGDRDALRNSGWKVVNCGGEPLLPTLQGDFRALGKADLRLFNAYAPCEVTFVSHEIEIDYNKPTSEINTATVVGYSLPNYSVYILDNDLNPLPAGMSGQIAIGGGGVAAGYLRSELTETCFKLNPFATERDVANGWTTMYLTGDRGFLRDDGALVFTSRLSSQTQVKIRGMRFDLQDVEANLIRTAKGVLAGAVVSLRSSNPQFLVAHVTFTNACDLTDRGTFCQTLIDELPLSPHMKPVVIVPVEEIPLTVNSKVDRIAVQQLPLPDSSRMLQDGSDFSAIEKQLLALWRDLLPVEVLRLKTITIDTDFFSIGGNSLLLVKLQAEMNQHFGVLIPLVQLFETPTLRGMSSRLGGMDAHDVGPINWDNEIELLQLLAPPTSTTASRESMFQPCSVVLTGATGFLGRAILRQLLEQPGVERIDCIAVRNMSHRKLPAIFSSPKVYLHAGDLTLPNLGLSDAATIFDRADVVVHNAADVSFMKSYHSLRPSNVDSTRYLITLTAPRRIPLHYVSSAGVAHLAGGEPLGEVSVADFTPPTDGSDGYVATKWASERLLECAHALTGLPVWIHRPSSIMGDGAPETDLMANLLKYTLTLRAVPLLQTGTREQKSKSKSFLDFVDVDTTARAIVHSITDADRGWTSEVKYTYHSGEYIIPVDALSMEPKDENVTGGANDVFTEGFKLLPLAEWTEKAKAAGMDELIVEFLKTAVNNAKPLGDLVLFPRLLKGEEIS